MPLHLVVREEIPSDLIVLGPFSGIWQATDISKMEFIYIFSAHKYSKKIGKTSVFGFFNRI